MSKCRATPYRVTARRNGGQGWTVIVEGIEGVGGFSIWDLSEVEAKARRHIFGYTDRQLDEIDLDVTVVIGADIEQRLEVAERLIEDAGEELAGAIDGMFVAGCVPADVRWIINHRALALRVRALTVSNAELAAHGLAAHPEVTGVRWSEHGFAVTIKCRDCVEGTRYEYFGLEEVGTNDLLYGPVVCDFCDVGHPDIEAVG